MPEKKTLQSMAEEIFELYKLVAIARARQPANRDELSETEFLALDLLVQDEPLTVGEIQKRIGVVPAQMSRIARSLESDGGKGLIDTKINQQDRRRVDVSLTVAGRRAYDDYRVVRLRSMRRTLEALDSTDQEEFMRMLRLIREAFAAQIEAMDQ